MRYRPIRRNSEYGRVYARGKSYVNPALVLYVLKTRGKKTRVGLTATKKIGHAVQRQQRPLQHRYAAQLRRQLVRAAHALRLPRRRHQRRAVGSPGQMPLGYHIKKSHAHSHTPVITAAAWGSSSGTPSVIPAPCTGYTAC